MPKLINASEKFGKIASIQLDDGNTCFISVARTGVLVRCIKPGYLNSILGSFFGAVLYKETNLYNVAQAAIALRARYPEVPAIQLEDLVLKPFADAVWQCATAGEAAVVLNEATSQTGP